MIKNAAFSKSRVHESKQKRSILRFIMLDAKFEHIAMFQQTSAQQNESKRVTFDNCNIFRTSVQQIESEKANA